MKHRRPADQQAYDEGRKAAEEGKPYRDQCPYEFRFCNCTREEFEDQFRVKCESWFRGWQEGRPHGVAGTLTTATGEVLREGEDYERTVAAGVAGAFNDQQEKTR